MNQVARNIISGIVFVLILHFLLFSGCKDNSAASGDCPASERTGAVCNDGTTSSATGSGACSSHGGVRNWICR